MQVNKHHSRKKNRHFSKQFVHTFVYNEELHTLTHTENIGIIKIKGIEILQKTIL